MSLKWASKGTRTISLTSRSVAANHLVEPGTASSCLRLAARLAAHAVIMVAVVYIVAFDPRIFVCVVCRYDRVEAVTGDV